MSTFKGTSEGTSEGTLDNDGRAVAIVAIVAIAHHAIVHFVWDVTSAFRSREFKKGLRKRAKL